MSKRTNRPKGFWPDLIISVLRRLGGVADLKDITEWTESTVDLTAHELDDSGYQGRPRYFHTLRTTASFMYRRGQLDRVPHGRYRLPVGR